MKFDRAPRGPCSPRLALEHLDGLEVVHDDLLAALACKRAATREPVPHPIMICHARWTFGRASRAHFMMVDTILSDLSSEADLDTMTTICALREGSLRMQQQSTRYIRDWNPTRIVAEWPLYCAASELIGGQSEKRVETEKRLIKLLLRRRSLRWLQPEANGLGPLDRPLRVRVSM